MNTGRTETAECSCSEACSVVLVCSVVCCVVCSCSVVYSCVQYIEFSVVCSM